MSTENITLTEAELLALLPNFVIYCIQGFALLILNGIVFLALTSHEVLRRKKEYVLLAGLALTDALGGFGFFTAGIGRIYLIITGQGGEQVTRWQCLLTPWNIAFVLWEQSYGPMLAAISVDRLISVRVPLQHLGFTTTYAYSILALVYCPTIISICSLVYQLEQYSDHLPDRPRICYTERVYTQTHYRYVYFQSIVLTFASVVIYAFVLVFFRQKNQISPANGSHNNTNLRRQRRLTVTLGISCLFTYLFYIMPVVIKVTALDEDSVEAKQKNTMVAKLIPLIGIIVNINPLANFFIYTSRHQDIRLAVKYLFKCQTLTPLIIEQASEVEREIEMQIQPEKSN